MTLTAQGISFRYHRRDRWVLEDVSLRVEPGERVGLWGPSGCGKSTLGAILSGHLVAERGQVRVDGSPLSSGGGRARPVQLIHQHADRAMNPRWRIDRVLAEPRPAYDDPDRAAAVSLAGLPAGLPAADLATAGLAEGLVEPQWLDRYPHELSGGQLQRVSLARTLAAGPRYVVADEITASLDPLTQAGLWRQLIAHTQRHDIGLLVSSHDRDLLDVVVDRVIELGRG